MRWIQWRLDTSWLPEGASDPADHDDVCMCGSSMEGHSLYDNHLALSAAEYYRRQRRDDAVAAFSPAVDSVDIVDELLGVR